jgi:hypothetical protein
MIDNELVKKYFVGRDGFIWWIGQIAPENKWSPNVPGRRVASTGEIKGFNDRFKVRILGYHDVEATTPLDDLDLPWAQVMLPVTAGGGSGASSQSVSLHQGTFVYGFFLDGEDAQQPVIMGILGYNQYSQVPKSAASAKLLPFDGKYGIGSDDKVPNQNIRESPAAAPEAGGQAAVVPSPKIDAPKPSTDGLIITCAQSESLTDICSKNQKEDGEKASSIPKTQRCDKQSGMGGIAVEVTNALQSIQEISAKATGWAAAVNGKIDTIQAEIDSKIEVLTKKVTEYVKWIIDQVRSATIEKIESAAKDLYYLVFPNKRPKILEEQKKVMDLISCLIDKIVGGLIGLVGAAIAGLLNKFLNVTSCLVENFLGSLLGNILGGLVGGIKGILGAVQGVLGAIGSVGGIIDSVVGLIKNLLAFGAAFTCQEDPSCPEIEEWSIWKGVEGASSILGGIGAVSGLIGQAKNIGDQVVGIADQISGSVQSGVDAVDSAVNFVKGAGSAVSDAVKSSLSAACDAGPIKCGPPTVNIIGGGGFGAAANAVISAAGEVLAIDMVDQGFGFTSTPTAFLKDPCGKGKGSKLKVNMKQKSINANVGIVTAGGGDFPQNNSNLSPTDQPTLGTLIPGRATGGVTGGATGLLPKITLTANPYPVLVAGTDVSVTWKTENATEIVTSSFPTGRLLEGTFVAEDFVKSKTFTVTARNQNGQSTASLFVSVNGDPGGGRLVIDNIIVIDPGTDYLQEPDGTLGAFGREWADPINRGDTVVKDPDGNYLPPIPPGEFVILPKGSTIIPCNSCSGFTTTTGDVTGQFLQLFPKGIESEIKEDVIITTPQPAGKNERNEFNSPSTTDSKYGAVLFLSGIEIIDAGINYTDVLDTIELSPRNGSELSLRTGPFGKIDKVNIKSSGSGFQVFPEVIINSQTGFNANIVPIFGIKRIGEGNAFDLALEQIDRGIPIINVVDCTSRISYRPDPQPPNRTSAPNYA